MMSDIVTVQELNSKPENVNKNCLNLVTIISNVAFYDPSFETNGSFQDFVSRLLARRDGYRIRRFSLKLRSMIFDQVKYDLVNDCVRNVLKRGVLDLELNIDVNEDYALPFEVYELPFEVFTCKNVVKLKLGSGFVLDEIPQTALLPALKTLLLHSVRFRFDDDSSGGCALKRLLSACPVLEELVIYRNNREDWKWDCIVSSQILKRLTIRREQWSHDGDSYEPISFDTPNLEYFEYFDVLRDEYPVVNFNSLVEAKLELPHLMYADTYDLKNLIKGLKNVHILILGAVETIQLFGAFSEAVPVFENLFHLSVSTQEDLCCWGVVRFLLEKSPNLKTLAIEALHYTNQDDQDVKSVCKCLKGYIFLLSCHIKFLKITQFKGDIGEMVQIEHLLGKLPHLELLEIHSQATSNDKKRQIMVDLVRLKRASSKCKVDVKFS